MGWKLSRTGKLSDALLQKINDCLNAELDLPKVEITNECRTEKPLWVLHRIGGEASAPFLRFLRHFGARPRP